MDNYKKILRYAKQQDVDFIVHSGDLFDENKPTRRTMFETMNLLRKYCMGAGNHCFQVNHVDRHAGLASEGLNFLDKSYNVAIPIFLIHGNHDDPGGLSKLSANDILSSAKLVNYFGRQDDLDNINVGPICLQKGTTKLVFEVENLAVHCPFQQSHFCRGIKLS